MIYYLNSSWNKLRGVVFLQMGKLKLEEGAP